MNAELATPPAPVRRPGPSTVVVAVVVALLALVGGRAFYAEVWGGSPGAVVTATGARTPPASSGAEGTSAAVADGPLPAVLAGLARTSLLTGVAARQAVEQLHGTALGAGLDGAWVAQYGGDKATVWVSRSTRQADAQQLLERMTAKIDQAVAAGRSPFTAPVATDVAGITVYELDGMGQKHGYFLTGNDLYWLAAPSTLAARSLGELVAAAR